MDSGAPGHDGRYGDLTQETLHEQRAALFDGNDNRSAEVTIQRIMGQVQTEWIATEANST